MLRRPTVRVGLFLEWNDSDAQATGTEEWWLRAPLLPLLTWTAVTLHRSFLGPAASLNQPCVSTICNYYSRWNSPCELGTPSEQVGKSARVCFVQQIANTSSVRLLSADC
jgi:hypothetical protein